METVSKCTWVQSSIKKALIFIDENMDEKAKQPRKDMKRSYRRSYLLRLWRRDELGGFNWQASLEIPETGQRIGFASLEELFAYLMDLTTRYEL